LNQKYEDCDDKKGVDSAYDVQKCISRHSKIIHGKQKLVLRLMIYFQYIRAVK